MPDALNSSLQPHRGVLVLILGILGLLLCFPLGIVAWIIGNGDLEAMRSGRMDRTGEGLTQAGRICGMVSVALAALGLVLGLLFFVMGMGSAIMSH